MNERQECAESIAGLVHADDGYRTIALPFRAGHLLVDEVKVHVGPLAVSELEHLTPQEVSGLGADRQAELVALAERLAELLHVTDALLELVFVGGVLKRTHIHRSLQPA